MPKKTDASASTTSDDAESRTGRARCSVPSGHPHKGLGDRRSAPFVSAASGTFPAPKVSAVSRTRVDDRTGIVSSEVNAPDTEQRSTLVALIVSPPSTVNDANALSRREMERIFPPPRIATDTQLEIPPR